VAHETLAPSPLSSPLRHRRSEPPESYMASNEGSDGVSFQVSCRPSAAHAASHEVARELMARSAAMVSRRCARSDLQGTRRLGSGGDRQGRAPLSLKPPPPPLSRQDPSLPRTDLALVAAGAHGNRSGGRVMRGWSASGRQGAGGGIEGLRASAASPSSLLSGGVWDLSVWCQRRRTWSGMVEVAHGW
jgi:hypothetical protein